MAKARPRQIGIRAAEPEDFAEIARLYADRSVYADTLQLPFPSKELWRKRLSQDDETSHSLVAIVDGEIVGQLGLSRLTRARRAHVGQLGMGVREAWQGKGIGTALMGAATDIADHWLGLRRLELTVYADNRRAIALYHKFGFEIEGTHKAFALRDGIYVDALAMARVISGPVPPVTGGKRSRKKV